MTININFVIILLLLMSYQTSHASTLTFKERFESKPCIDKRGKSTSSKVELPNRSNNPLDNLYINSNSLSLNRTNNTAYFEGEVIIWFDNMILKTKEIKIIYKGLDNKKEIDKIIIPKKLFAIKEKEQEVLIADSAEYFAIKGELILTGKVKIQRGNKIITTKKLVYYTKLKTIQSK